MPAAVDSSLSWCRGKCCGRAIDNVVHNECTEAKVQWLQEPRNRVYLQVQTAFEQVQGQRVEAELLTLWPMLQVEYAEAKVQWLQELHERECAELEEMLAREYQERVLQEHEKVGWEMHCVICFHNTDGKEREPSSSAADACLDEPGDALRHLLQDDIWRTEGRGGMPH